MEKSPSNNGIILLDCMIGIGIFLITFTFSAQEISYFLKTISRLNHTHDELLDAINTLNTIQQGHSISDDNINSVLIESSIRCYKYDLPNTSFFLYVHE